MASSGSGDLEEVSLAMSKVSLQVVEDDGEVKKIDRHCSFCLTLVPGAEVKLCSKCKRRAYCSKECQTADWKLSKEKPAFNGKIYGYGQGHKNWCGLPYGEEDLDWKVAPISGKGLGLVALRNFPPLYRIIVDGIQPMPVHRIDGSFSPHHPGMDDLFSVTGQSAPLPEKFRRNSWRVGDGPMVGLRTARTNHSCAPNAFYTDEEEFRVLILSSAREIKEGEEICISYIPIDDIAARAEEYKGRPPEYFHHILFHTWGIVCPPSCSCRDLEKLEMLDKCRNLFEECERDSKRKNVLKKMEKIIEIAGKVGCCPSTMSDLDCRASEFAEKALEMKKAREYLGKYLEFFKAVYHPKNEIGQHFVDYLSKL